MENPPKGHYRTITINSDTVPLPSKQKEKSVKWQRVAPIVATVFVILVIGVLGGLLAKETLRNWFNSASQSSMNNTQCAFDESSIIRSAVTLQYMDSTQDPCSDFSAYSCKGFQDMYALPNPEYLFTAVPTLLMDRRIQELARILEGERENQLSDFLVSKNLQRTYQQVLTYYGSCKRTLNYQTALKFQPHLNAVYGRTIIETMSAANQLIKTRLFGISSSNPLCRAQIAAAVINTSPNSLATIFGYPTNDGTLFTTWFFDFSFFSSYGPNLKGHLTLLPQGSTARNILANPTAINSYAYQIYNILKIHIFQQESPQTVQARTIDIVTFEQKLMAIMPPRPEQFNPNWSNVSTSFLDQNFPFILNATGGWRYLLESMNTPEDIINGGLLVSSMDYLSSLNELMRETSWTTLFNYASFISLIQSAALAQLQGLPYNDIVWNLPTPDRRPGASLISSYFKLDYLEKRQYNEENEPGASTEPIIPWSPDSHGFYMNLSSLNVGTRKLLFPESRGEIKASVATLYRQQSCIEETVALFPAFIGVLFQESVLSTRKQDVVNLVQNIRTAYVNRIANSSIDDWIEDSSRTRAVQKIQSMHLMIAAPDLFRDNRLNFTQRFYGFHEASLGPNHYLNSFHANRYLNWMPDGLSQMDFRDAIMSYYQDWTAVNAFYSPTINTMLLPMGFLQYPVYTAGNSGSMSYGSLGAIIGHEMTHALDTNGIQFDKYGNTQGDLVISANTMGEYQRRASCFASYVTRYRAHNIAVNGNKTMAENIADNGGLKVAWDAYQLHIQQGLSGADSCASNLIQLDNGKLFWISFAQLWCVTMDAEYEQQAIQNDVHTVMSKRTNAAVALIDAFAETWQCPQGSNMNPAANDTYGHCSLWRRSKVDEP